MINFLPPAGLPLPQEPGGARHRREPGPDFAQWLQPTPEGAAPRAPGEGLPLPVSSASHPHLSLPLDEAPHPLPILQNMPQAAADVPAFLEQLSQHFEQMAQRLEQLPQHFENLPPERQQALSQRIADMVQHFEALAQHFHELSQQFEGQVPQLHEIVAALHPHLPEPAGAHAHAHAELADPVLLPWRLQANAGLSYLGTPAWLAAAAQMTPATGEAMVTSADASASLPAEAEGLAARTDATPRRDVAAWIANLSDHGFGGVDREQRMERLAQYLAAHPDWKERLLRWVGDEADLTAWIRDFQLGEDDLAALVGKLREYAQEHGHPLARVVHNGREVWRAGNDQLQQGSES